MTTTDTLTVDLLPPERWPEVDPIYRDEFDQFLPHPQDSIVAVYAAGEIVAFAGVERWVHVGPVYVQPARRDGRALKLLLGYIEAALRGAGRAGYVLASHKGVERLCVRRGLVQVPGTLLRLDFK